MLVSAYVLEGFNNYFNRKVKRFDYVQEYITHQVDNDKRYNKLANNPINFNPNDGVSTTHIANLSIFGDNEWIPDYLIIVGKNAGVIGYDLVESRWFIVECKRTRQGQYELKLRRDVMADFWPNIKEAPIYVEKANIPTSNKLIYNSEGLSLNQIKKGETKIKDETQMAWIVGYIARNKHITASEVISVKTDYTQSYLEEIEIDSIPSYNYIFQGSQSISMLLWYQEHWVGLRIILNQTFEYQGYQLYSVPQTQNNEMARIYGTGYVLEDLVSYIANAIVSNNAWQYFASVSDREMATNEANNFLRSCSGKTWSDNSIYGILNVDGLESNTINQNTSSNPSSSASINVSNNIDGAISDYNTDKGTNLVFTAGYFVYRLAYKVVYLYYSEFNPGTIDFSVSQNRLHLNDAPYDMFCIPYCDSGDIAIYDPINGKIGSASKSYALTVAQIIGLHGEGANAEIYDLQLLPFCPLSDVMNASATHLVLNGTNNTDYSLVTLTVGSDVTNVQIIYYCLSSNFSKLIPMTIGVKEVKVENECDMYRLCSPNYQGVYEFNLAKNGGLNYFEATCTYKPFNPYIHIAPNFGNLYGQDYDDARGLICGGDFSIAIVSDAWKQYEINNKNYQNMFDRQIKTLNIEQNYNRIGNIAGAIAGAGQGALMGGMLGGPVGAVAGGVASGIGGIADVAISEGRFKESIQYKTDMYNYQLGNIKALPYSLTKAAAQNYDNKLFPFLEYYSCTEEEKELVRNKIKYNGMTVNAIATISQYLGYDDEYYWFQGQLIRLETISKDTHLVDAIYDEIKKGVYINGKQLAIID